MRCVQSFKSIFSILNFESFSSDDMDVVQTTDLSCGGSASELIVNEKRKKVNLAQKMVSFSISEISLILLLEINCVV